jgi:hypothetical protein
MFEDFIAIFDNLLTPEECQQYIDYFENLKSMNLSFTRQALKDNPKHMKDDETVFPLHYENLPLHRRNPIMNLFLDKFQESYKQYAENYSILIEAEPHGIMSARLQKTLPGQGYHRWHFESSSAEVSSRVCAWMIYLNDVDHGGETEFLYLKRRISAKAGRLVIWPASFTHTHRGNPPLSGDKYVITGWMEYIGGSKP